VAGLLVGVSLLLHVVIDVSPAWQEADQMVWVRHAQPGRAPTKVVISKTIEPDRKEQRQDVTTRDEVIDDAEVVEQMYWVGIFNTDADFVPYVLGYRLDESDLNQLRHRLPEDVFEQLRPLKDRSFGRREQFEDAVDAVFPKGISYAAREAAIQQAEK